jgi:hypothetical protein
MQDLSALRFSGVEAGQSFMGELGPNPYMRIYAVAEPCPSTEPNQT